MRAEGAGRRVEQAKTASGGVERVGREEEVTQKKASGRRGRTGKRPKAKDGGGWWWWWREAAGRGYWGRRAAAKIHFARPRPGGRPDTYLALSPVPFFPLSSGTALVGRGPSKQTAP